MFGTFGFFFLGFSGLAAAAEREGSITDIGVALGFGLGLAAMIFTFGHISGAHFNPAVTLGLACGKQFAWKEVPGYWGAQFIGVAFAAGFASAIYGAVDGAFLNAPRGTDGQSLVVEIIGTMFLMLVISAVATDKTAPWSGVLAPVAISGYIFVAILVLGPFSSASFNPARSLSPAVIVGSGADLWIYIVGPTIGGIVGGFAYLFMRRPS
jgi:MIP family channel proteins